MALLSNPKSTGNLAQLPRIREFCADHPDLFHYEVEQATQIGEAMKSIAQVRPRVLAINGGDGTVQAVLTELCNGGHFGDMPPPVAVLPSGKTNLIALDLGARGDPIATLQRLIDLARADDLARYTVARELIALRRPGGEDRPVIGMFLGGAGLADTMLYCRDKIYPLGLPNGIAHGITAFALVMKLLLRVKGNFLPPDPQPLSVSLRDEGNRFS
ncbi:MAG TPA: acylglycerol kinase family protein, partial [Sphingomicrobium sp.]